MKPLLLLLVALISSSYAATTKVTDLPANTSPSDSSLLLVTDTSLALANQSGKYLLTNLVTRSTLVTASNAVKVASQATNSTLTRLAGIGAGVSGDVLFRDATGWTNLAKGADAKVLKLTSGFPSWQTDDTGGLGTAGTMINTGASTTSQYPKYTDTTGTNVAPDTITLASADFANQGTTTTLLHGNASGNPSWAAVDLATAQVTGVLPAANVDTAIARLASPTFTGTATMPTAAIATATIGTLTVTNTITAGGSGTSVFTNGLQLLNATASRLAMIDASKNVTNVAASSGLVLATGAAASAGTDYTSPSSTESFTNKTLDAAGTGNVLKQTRYMNLMRPDWGDGTGAVPQTNSFVASGLMHYTFSGSAETNANYVVYETIVPPDIDTSVAMTATFAFLGSGTDADTVTFHIAYGLGVVGSTYPVALANIATSPLAFAAVTPTTPAAGDYQTTAALTLTGWAASMTAGTPLLISVRRLNDSNDDTMRDLYLRIAYGSTQ